MTGRATGLRQPSPNVAAWNHVPDHQKLNRASAEVAWLVICVGAQLPVPGAMAAAVAAAAAASTPAFHKVLFENDRVRVLDFRLAPQERVCVNHEHATIRWQVGRSTHRLRDGDANTGDAAADVADRQVFYVEAGVQWDLTSTGAPATAAGGAVYRQIVFELLCSEPKYTEAKVSTAAWSGAGAPRRGPRHHTHPAVPLRASSCIMAILEPVPFVLQAAGVAGHAAGGSCRSGSHRRAAAQHADACPAHSTR